MSTRRRPLTSSERVQDDDDAAEMPPRRAGRKVEIKDTKSPSPARTPSNVRNGPSPRITFSKTRTLKGAFESTAGEDRPADAQMRGSPSKYPVGRSPGDDGPISISNDLFESYGGAGGQAYMDALDDFEDGQLSPSPNTRRRFGTDNNERYGNESFDFMNLVDEPVQRRRSQHEADQQRLKRATERGTPVLSKAMAGARAKPSARARTEHIPPQNEGNYVNEGGFERHAEPALNIPKNWGQRGRLSRHLLERVRRETQNNEADNEVELQPEPESENDVDFTARSLQVSNSPPVKTRTGPREPDPMPAPATSMGTSSTNMNQNNGSADSRPNDEFASGGKPIPNTPIVVYENSNQERPRTVSRDDSQSLLRKLARKESPSFTNSTPAQNNTEQRTVPDTISNMKTPVVMGAWIDTPAPERTASAAEPTFPKDTGTQSASEADLAQSLPEVPPAEEQTAAKTSPQKKAAAKPHPARRRQAELEKLDLPKSALADVIQEAKTGHNQSLAIGENTIDSLQGILNEDSNTTELKNAENLTSPVSTHEKEETESADNSLVLPKTDEAVIDRLNSKLVSLVRNIKEVRDGLTGLETQASKDATVLTSRGQKPPSKQSHSCRKGQTCEICGVADDGRRYVALPIPILWHRSPRANRIRPTPLGWALLAVLLWYISESTMCDVYCHPFSLSDRTGRFFVDPNAPRMPWVIPTILWRWSHLSAIFAPIWAFFVAIVRLVAQMFGFWDGFVDTPASYSARGQARPAMDDVTASFIKAKQGYGRDEYHAMEPEEPMWHQDYGDQGLSMQEDEIL